MQLGSASNYALTGILESLLPSNPVTIDTGQATANTSLEISYRTPSYSILREIMGFVSCEREKWLAIVVRVALPKPIYRSTPLRVCINHMPLAIFVLKEDFSARVGFLDTPFFYFLIPAVRHLSVSYATFRCFADFAFPP